MPRIRADIRNNIPDAARSIREVLAVATRRAMEFEGQRLRREIVSSIGRQKLVATGDLRKSIFAETYLVKGGDFPEIRIGSSMEYGRWVEEGTPPHTPPINALTNWVRMKRAGGAFRNETGPGAARFSKKTGKRLGKKWDQLAQDTAIAWRIWQKIRKHGTRPHPFAGPVFTAEKEKVPTRVNASIRRALTRHYAQAGAR